MKILKLKYILSFAVVMSLVLFMGSCTNDDVFQSADGEVDFSTLGVNYEEKGALLLISGVQTGLYDLSNLAGASIGFTVDAIGEAVNSVDINVSYGGQTAQVSTISSFPSTATFPLSTVLSALGVSGDVLKVGDVFTFSLSNVTTANGAFSSGTTLSIPVSCPLAATKFVGAYTISYEGTAGTGYGVPFTDGGTVRLTVVSGAPTRRNFDATYLPGIGGFGPYTSRIDFECGKAVFLGMVASGLGCGAGSIELGPVTGANGVQISPAFDPNDDTQFKIVVDEGYATGGCASITNTSTTIVFTKQ